MTTRKRRLTFFDAANYLIMFLVIVFTFYPFLYIISYSLSNPSLVSGGLLFFPRGLTFQSYIYALSDRATLHGIGISVERTVLGPIVMIIVTSMAAYCITRQDLVGVKWIRKFFVFTMYFSSGLIPLYLMMKALHLTGSFWIYIVPSAVSVFNMILIKTYIEALPESMEEAAVIDGANDLILYWRIIFPLCVPVIAAVVLFAAVDQWNSFIDTQIYNAMNPELFSLQYVLYQTLSSATSLEQVKENMNGAQAEATAQSLKMAITMITVIPILFVYPILQKHFAKGLLIGSIKG